MNAPLSAVLTDRYGSISEISDGLFLRKTKDIIRLRQKTV